jgi:multiple antibiotic resistance protein
VRDDVVMDWTFALSSLATLIAILDPIGATAIFLAFFGGRPPAEQRRAARITATTVLVTAVVAFLWGERILAFFGISIAALKVTGGLIIGSVGASMLRGTLAASPAAAEPPEDAARAVAAAAMVPVGVPIIGGAGTISTVIVFSHLSQNWRQWASLVGVIAVSVALLFLTLRSAERVHRFIGRTGLDLLSRLMGLILLAMGVQFVADGADDLFPALRPGR